MLGCVTSPCNLKACRSCFCNNRCLSISCSQCRGIEKYDQDEPLYQRRFNPYTGKMAFMRVCTCDSTNHSCNIQEFSEGAPAWPCKNSESVDTRSKIMNSPLVSLSAWGYALCTTTDLRIQMNLDQWNCFRHFLFCFCFFLFFFPF